MDDGGDNSLIFVGFFFFVLVSLYWFCLKFDDFFILFNCLESCVCYSWFWGGIWKIIELLIYVKIGF